MRQCHLGDVPPEAARIVLLERVLRLAPKSPPVVAEPVQPQRTQRDRVHLEQSPSHEAPADDQSTRGHQTRSWRGWALTGLGFSVAAAAALVLVVGSDDQPNIHPEPTQAAATQPPHVVRAPQVPCTAGRGDGGAIARFSQTLQIAPAGYGPEGSRGQTGLPIPEFDGRSGSWFHTRNSVDDVGLPQALRVATSPALDAAPSDFVERPFALNAAGPPPVGWGVNFGVRFDRCYDASAYAGVEVSLRGAGVLFIGFQTLDSVPVEFGGRCTTRCWFTGGRNIALRDEFVTHRIRWEDLSPASRSSGIPSELMQIMFSVQSGPEPYDIWVDELRFLPKEPSD